MDNYIIIHGSFGSKDGNWFPWLKNELEKDNKDVVVPQMPVGVGNQNFENWSKVLNELKINENTLVIGNIGRFVEQKNHEYLIDIFKDVHNKYKNSVLVLVGQGPLIEKVKAKVKKYKLEK